MWRWRCNILAELSGTTQFSMWRVDTHTHTSTHVLLPRIMTIGASSCVPRKLFAVCEREGGAETLADAHGSGGHEAMGRVRKSQGEQREHLHPNQTRPSYHVRCARYASVSLVRRHSLTPCDAVADTPHHVSCPQARIST